MPKLFLFKHIFPFIRFLRTVWHSFYLPLADYLFYSLSIVLNLNGQSVKKRDPASYLEWKRNVHNAEPFPKKYDLIFAAGEKRHRSAD